MTEATRRSSPERGAVALVCLALIGGCRRLATIIAAPAGRVRDAECTVNTNATRWECDFY
jgi:hypothetical protein